MSATAPFTPATLTFLRALKRNNNRAWFLERKADYERDVQRPMQLVIERLGREFESFAPEQMADPKKSLYRIWRDTRFSGDKRPLKTNVAAVFPHRRGTRHTSAGFYIEIEAKWVFAGGGQVVRARSGPERSSARSAALGWPGRSRGSFL